MRIVRGSAVVAFVLMATACTSIAGIDRYYVCESTECTDATVEGSTGRDEGAAVCRIVGSCETLGGDGGILDGVERAIVQRRRAGPAASPNGTAEREVGERSRATIRTVTGRDLADHRGS